MNHHYKLINPDIVHIEKGDVIKYSLKSNFFNKGIKDFYFSELNLNCSKGWKLKKKLTVIIVIKGKIKFILKNKDHKIRLVTLKESDKKILIINKNISFKFINIAKKKSILISFLNEVY